MRAAPAGIPPLFDYRPADYQHIDGGTKGADPELNHATVSSALARLPTVRRKIDASSSRLRKASMPAPSGRLHLRDLIERGLISAPTPIFGFHSGRRIQARLDVDGTISYRRQRYSSPSLAAGQVITARTGFAPPGRPYHSVNGWRFWWVPCPDGESRTLAEIREQMLRSLSPSEALAQLRPQRAAPRGR
jgi:hypothetical protein